MARHIALVGFGEAASTFARAGRWGEKASAYDIKTDDPATREMMLASYCAADVAPSLSAAHALRGARLVLSLVTADQVLAVARAVAREIEPGALYCDFNSVAPQTKQAAARAIEAAGGRYVDGAIMAPVDPARLNVPLLLSGAGADAAATQLAELGFVNLRVVGDSVGRASAIKMIRSVMVKGIEALTAECVRAAGAAGVLEEVVASLDASERPRPWAARADYNLGRMLIHGSRRAAEMEEVVKTLSALGTGDAMSRATVEVQRRIGGLDINMLPDGLSAKLDCFASELSLRATAIREG